MRCLVLLTALATFAISACTHAPPIVEPTITCGANIVTAENIRRIEHDLANLNNGGEADLLAWVVEAGAPFVSCLVQWYIQNGTAAQKTAASRFQGDHKAELSGPVSFRSHAPPGRGPGLVMGGGA